MSLTSLSYIVFALAGAFLCYIFSNGARRYIVLVLSVLFYALTDLRSLPAICLVTAMVYASGLLVGASKKPGLKKAVAAIGTISCVLLLAIYKYTGLIRAAAGGITSLFGATLPEAGASIAAPLGISYIIFRSISYLFDTANGKCAPERNPASLSVFLLFFPAIIAGPIEKPDDLLAQIDKRPVLTRSSVTKASYRILLGFVKKFACADIFGYFVNNFYSSGELSNGVAGLVCALFYSAQIYFDFSGYTDVALGSASLLGFSLPENFNHPYAATGIRDFWQRWHMSLTRWLRDYIYIPLGGNRHGKFRKELNILITFTVSGLWHGANFTFIVWGALHGLLQIAEDIVFGKRQKKEPGAINACLLRALTFMLVTFAWIFFRAPDIGSAASYIGGLFGGWNRAAFESFASVTGFDVTLFICALASTVTAILFERLIGRMRNDSQNARRTVAEIGTSQNKASATTVPLVIACVFCVLLVFLSMRTLGGASNEFIYFNF